MQVREQNGCLVLAGVERPARTSALAEMDDERAQAGAPLPR